jgi:hypothetical protein
MPYSVMATLIVAFTATTSFTFMAVVPFRIGGLAVFFALLKASLVAGWLLAAWRVKKDRERAFLQKQADGTLWSEDIAQRALRISLKTFEVIRYHFEAGEKIEAVFRRHKFTLWEAILWLNIMVGSLLFAAYLGAYLPALEWRPDDWHIWVHFKVNGDDVSIFKDTVYFSNLGFRFVWWWLPLLITLPAFYVMLKKWQKQKWRIRSITNRNIYLILEQPTYMPWIAPEFDVVPVEQVVGMSVGEAGAIGGMVGWTNITLKKQADKAEESPELIEIDHVDNGQEIVDVLRRVLPMFQNDNQAAEPEDDPQETSTEDEPQVTTDDSAAEDKPAAA